MTASGALDSYHAHRFLLLLFLSTRGCSALQNHALSLSTISSRSMTPFSGDAKQTVQLLLLLRSTWERQMAGVYPHMLLFTPRRTDKFCKNYVLGVTWLQFFFSFSFLSPLLSLPNTENLNEEKSLIFHKRIKIVNVCGSIGKMGKDFCLFFCSESLFFFLLCFLHLERAFKHLEY